MKNQQGVVLGAGLLGLGLLGVLALAIATMKKEEVPLPPPPPPPPPPPEAVIGLRVEQQGGLMRYVYTLDNPTPEPITIARYNSVRQGETWGWADMPGAIWTIQPGEFGERYWGWATPGYYGFQPEGTYTSAVGLIDTQGKLYWSETIVFTIEV